MERQKQHYVATCSSATKNDVEAGIDGSLFLFYFSLKQLQLIAWFYLLSSFHTHVRVRIWGPVSISAVYNFITIHAR